MAEEKQTPKIEKAEIVSSESKTHEGDKKTEKKIASENLMVVIRIAGQVKVIGDVKNTLERLRLRKKYSCVLLKPTKEILGMVNKIRYHIAFGNIDKKTLVELIKARGKTLDKSEVNAEKIADELISGKRLLELGLKPFFSLHPPRKGIKSKLQYPKGVLGNNKEDINKLVERML